MPSVTWDQTTVPNGTVVLIDPDAPDRNADPSKPGTYGPWLHWLVTGCELGAAGNTCTTIRRLEGPAPPKGNHRYIFVLFKQTGAHPDSKLCHAATVVATHRLVAGDKPVQFDTVERSKWPFGAFLSANKDRLVPVDMTFFYCDSKGVGEL
jgi:phosphatidylethanolamine-binding protein (PEBP) family uncharacterized protein